MDYFRSRPAATATIETWRNDCNDVRPHADLVQWQSDYETDVKAGGR